eukprot:536677-Rhodomonas_salina.1
MAVDQQRAKYGFQNEQVPRPISLRPSYDIPRHSSSSPQLLTLRLQAGHTQLYVPAYTRSLLPISIPVSDLLFGTFFRTSTCCSWATLGRARRRWHASWLGCCATWAC